MSVLDAIRKLSEDYEIAHLAGDGQALARLFRDDAVIIPPNKPAIEGRKNSDRFFDGVTGGTGLKTETLRFEVHEPIAVASVNLDSCAFRKHRYPRVGRVEFPDNSLIRESNSLFHRVGNLAKRAKDFSVL